MKNNPNPTTKEKCICLFPETIDTACPVHGSVVISASYHVSEPEVTDKEDLYDWSYKELEPYFQGEFGTMDTMLEMFCYQLMERVRKEIACENNKLRIRYNEESRKMEEEHKEEISNIRNDVENEIAWCERNHSKPKKQSERYYVSGLEFALRAIDFNPDKEMERKLRD